MRLPLVRFRAQAMQKPVPVGTGAMAAVLGLDAAQVVEGCAKASGRSAARWSKRPTSTTPGRPSSPARWPASSTARDLLKSMGAKRVVQLPVSAPFHCSLMRPAAEALRERLAEVAFAAPKICR